MSAAHNAGKNIEPPGGDITRAEGNSVELNSYEFTALIKTKRCHYFQQDYQDIESFRQEMKEHLSDVVWGVLLRCETGNSVDVFYSGERQKIGLVDTEPKSSEVTPEGLNTQQAALREAAIKHFKSNKIKAYIAQQLEHINFSLQLGGEIRNLFDDKGRPPANAPLEDIIEEREKTEARIEWLEAICSELRNNVTKLKEIEDFARNLINYNRGKK